MTAVTPSGPVDPGEPARPRTPDDVLLALDPEQRLVAASPLGPMCVLAGAGTGKTRAITHRIAYGVLAGAYRPQQVLAVTFTARAAGEMRTRLRELSVRGVQARTFHAAALRQLHFFWPRAIGGGAPDVMAHKAAAVAEAGQRLRLQLDRAAIRDLAGEVEWAKVSMLTPETYPEAAGRVQREPPGLDAVAMARLLHEYEEVKTARGVIDFEDVLLLLVGIMAERDDIAGEIRAQYRHFVVDEYQDVNVVQQRLLRLWLGERRDVCVVGDPAQTIYSFTGATPTHLLDFPRTHRDAEVVRLVRNYRSSPQIIGVANAVISGQRGRVRTPVQLTATRPAGPAPTLVPYPDDESEAAGTVAGIEKLLAGGVEASDVAVLYRINGQSEAFESALGAAGIPYLVRGGERFFARAEVRRAVVLLRGAARSDDASVPLPDLARDVLAGAGWSPEPPATRGATREQWESLSALVHLAEDLARTQQDARLPDLVREIDERAASQHAPTVQGVTLASLHSAKGLEWDAVYLVGCSDGLMPISMAEGLEAIEEERRLLYVGLTRARRHLTLSWAAARHPGGRATRKPSRFLEPAAERLGDGVHTGRAERRAPDRSARRSSRRQAKPARCRACGTELPTAAQRKVGRCEDCPPAYDEAVFERLRAWRGQIAREAEIPAYVVFTDATLTAIAENAPQSLGALSRIPGVGARKLERFGEPVLALLGGATPEHAAAQTPGP